MILDWFPIWNTSVRFDFYAPVWVEEGRDDDHGGGRADEPEELAVDAAGGLPVFCASEVHSRAVDVFDGAAGVLESSGDKGEALVGLFGDVGVVRPNRAGAGDMDEVADAHGAGEANDGLEGRCACDVFASLSFLWVLRWMLVGWRR